MEEARLRVALDANVLIAGVRLPRWPYEVMRAALRGFFDLLLPSQVVEEAERHLQTPAQADALRFFLANARCQVLPMPTSDLVGREPDLVRSETDVPIALSLLEGEVDIFVSNDRDFTDPGATAERFTASCVRCGNPCENSESGSGAHKVGFGLIFDEAGSLEKLLGS